MKKRLSIILTLIAIILIAMTVLTGCEQIKKLLGQDGNDIKIPEIISLKTEKTKRGYLESKEYLVNKACTNPMALDDGEEYYIVISYDNPDKLAVSSVKINGVKYDSGKFESGSNYEKTYIKFAVEDTAMTETISYTVNNVMFINGTDTTRMRWADDVEKTVTVSVRPQFTLTLNYMNADRRSEASANDKNNTVQVKSPYYNDDLSKHGIVTPDYSEDGKTMPEKKGGWVFAGWFTKPNGEGDLIKETDTYYFWCDITLFAYYERMYETEIVELKEPIEYNYRTGTSKYKLGAVVTNKDYKNNELTHYYDLDIENTVVVEDITYTESVGMFGLNVYEPKVSYAEYPVVKIGNLAFQAFNTITDVRVGKFVEEIGYGAFWNCTKIDSFTFAEGSRLKYIGDYAFRETKSLTYLELPSTVEYLGNLAFRNSGWSTLRNKEGNGNTTTLTVRNTWKYIGFECFMNTGFSGVEFEAGCYFEGQINDEEGGKIESAQGLRDIEFKDASKTEVKSLIGARLFASCFKLSRVNFLNNGEDYPALNIIPDYCFDINNYEKDESKITYIQGVTFSEGLKYIGMYAFYYQKKIPMLQFPASLEEVDCFAFYENENVSTLEFAGDNESKLRILHAGCFGNLISLDSCTIPSPIFEKYGSGVFRACDRMKCVIFTNLTTVPVGYKKGERKNGSNDLEVVVGHKQADFLYATGEAGSKENINEGDKDGANLKDPKTYSSPLRIFCNASILEEFKEEMKRGKEMEAGKLSTGTSAYSKQVFVHSINNLRTYTYIDEDGATEITVQVAVQEVYIASNGQPSSNIEGYSIVYWSERNRYIKLPTSEQLNLSRKIIEVAYYAIPTSVNSIYIPKEYIRLDHDAFNNCTSLTQVEFEDVNTLEYIGNYAFFGTAIQGFVGGEKLAVIGEYAFQNCLALRWVDLRACRIVNTKNGSLKMRTSFKYTYELEDDDKDYNNCLGYGCFKGCRALTWIYLPKLKQLSTATFSGCSKLKTVIIPTLGDDIDDNTSATNDGAFYQYGQPNTVYHQETVHQLYILVDASAQTKHDKIFPLTYTDNGQGYVTGYGTISAENTVRPS